MGNNVWVVWKYPDDSFHGNEIQLIVTDGHISPEARRRGSGTPAYKIRKSSLRKLAELLYRQKALIPELDDEDVAMLKELTDE